MVVPGGDDDADGGLLDLGARDWTRRGGLVKVRLCLRARECLYGELQEGITRLLQPQI